MEIYLSASYLPKRKADLAADTTYSLVLALSGKAPKFLPVQRFLGLQVIDTKGVLVGNVKDVSVDFRNRGLAFVVVTKNGREVDVPWEDVLSLEDVILLNKELPIPAQAAAINAQPPPVVQARLICPNCGTSAPGQAKFCPKCGHNLK
jgi:sporulation protein YlmC with PRC-barrel domain